MKDNEEKTVYTLFFYKDNFKITMKFTENKNKIRTIKADLNTKNFLSKL